uniref:Zinc knuckle CX2CX4HX4C n=1 Tax=Tanacetum cinerariifolium TaxID=118510 RepID=A0A6L2LW88_TANCI|nr:hypothetical protein [Tanacetum cinerariifolium]
MVHDIVVQVFSDIKVRGLNRCVQTPLSGVVVRGLNCLVQTSFDVVCKVVVSGGVKRGFLSQKGSGVGRGVKEKDVNINKMNTSSGIGVYTQLDHTMNEDTPVGVAFAVKEGVTPSVVDMMMEKEKISSLEDTTVPESFPSLTTPVTTTACNASGKSSYANITDKPSGKKVNVHTLFTPRGNRIDVVVLVDSIRAISERFANTAYGFFLGKKVAYPVVANYVRNTWDKYGLVRSMFSSSTRLFSFQFSSIDGLDAMLEIDPCEDGFSVIATKLSTPLMLDSYTSDMCMQSWSRSSYARVMIELHADVELKDNIVVAMPKITREGHYTCNVHVEYEWKPHRKSTASSSGNEKKGVEPTIEVSNSNPFDVLNSVDNDLEFGTYGGTTNCGKAILVDKAVNPLKNVEFLSEYDSEDKVASVDNDMARSMAFERDLSHEPQDISVNLDIRVRGRKKK